MTKYIIIIIIIIETALNLRIIFVLYLSIFNGKLNNSN